MPPETYITQTAPSVTRNLQTERDEQARQAYVATLSPGAVLTLKPCAFPELTYRYVGHTAKDVCVRRGEGEGEDLLVLPLSRVVVPEVPKAIPGERYHHTDGLSEAVGLTDGRLRLVSTPENRYVVPIITYTPNWVLVR